MNTLPCGKRCEEHYDVCPYPSEREETHVLTTSLCESAEGGMPSAGGEVPLVRNRRPCYIVRFTPGPCLFSAQRGGMKALSARGPRGLRGLPRASLQSNTPVGFPQL